MKVPLPRALLSPAALDMLDRMEARGQAAEILAAIVLGLQRLAIADAIALGFSFAGPGDHTGERIQPRSPCRPMPTAPA